MLSKSADPTVVDDSLWSPEVLLEYPFSGLQQRPELELETFAQYSHLYDNCVFLKGVYM